MNEDFKKWVKSFSPEKAHWIMSEDEWLACLIKAIWKINREGEFVINLIKDKYTVAYFRKNEMLWVKSFRYASHNNSEQEALTEALKYIWENRK